MFAIGIGMMVGSVASIIFLFVFSRAERRADQLEQDAFHAFQKSASAYTPMSKNLWYNPAWAPTPNMPRNDYRN